MDVFHILLKIYQLSGSKNIIIEMMAHSMKIQNKETVVMKHFYN